jgi:hypothetical protein
VGGGSDTRFKGESMEGTQLRLLDSGLSGTLYSNNPFTTVWIIANSRLFKISIIGTENSIIYNTLNALILRKCSEDRFLR